MINVNQLTEQLRMLPDQALQQVAMMYKNDPYIFPMVISEGTARQKLRMAAQAKAQQAPQGTVADQAIMSMGQQPQAAPGIAALQAPNMERMADGGIAGYADDGQGYADGGSVTLDPGSTYSYQHTDMSPGMLDFAQRSEPVVRMAEGGAPRYQDRGLVRERAGEYALQALPQIEAILALDPYVDEKGNRRSERETASILSRQEKAQAQKAAAEAYQQKTPSSQVRTTAPKTALEALTARPTTSEVGPPLKEPPLLSESGQRYTLTAATPEAPAGVAKTEELPAPKKKETRTAADVVRQPAPVPAAPAAPAPTPAAPIPTYSAPTPEVTASGIEALMAAPKRDTESAYAELRKMYEPEEKELAQRRGQRGGEALLRAGLAMMSGTSPHAMVNIGKGATEGLNAYQEAQRYDDQAARALRQSQITMRMAERQEQIGNRRDAVTLFGQAQQQQQAAVSSAQQAEQLKNTRDYQQGNLEVMRQNAANNTKLVQARINALNLPAQQANRKMAEYGKLQKQVMADLSKDVTYMTETDPVKKEQIFRARINMAVANNPFLADLLFSGKPTGKVRDLEDTGDEQD